MIFHLILLLAAAAEKGIRFALISCNGGLTTHSSQFLVPRDVWLSTFSPTVFT
jgi:hypothetical protein